MGLQQSKDELLYQQVTNANTEAIKKLRTEGAALEWTDKEGKTPLILASSNPQLYDVAKTLTELGANVNAYRSGHHAGTPLHHAAQSGLVQMVNLLLSHGANALVLNDDCQTALDVARLKGNSNIVRAIESHICLFSGWLHEICEPGFLDLRAPKPKKVWVVVVPCGQRKQSKPMQLELAIYSGLQDAKPRTIMALWKANIDESNLNQPSPALIISSSKIPKRWRRKRNIGHSQVKQSRIKLAPVNENEKPQFKQFCNACKGITQVMHLALPYNNQVSNIEPPTQTARDPELPLPINASLQSGSEVGPTAPISYYPNSETGIYSQVVPTAPIIMSAPPSVPSAPLLPETVDDGPVHYPSIDSNTNDGEKEIHNKDSSSCVICLDAPVEGACIPCGHMAGCMMCLNEVKGKDWGCPVCRAKIEQVVRLYAV